MTRCRRFELSKFVGELEGVGNAICQQADLRA